MAGRQRGGGNRGSERERESDECQKGEIQDEREREERKRDTMLCWSARPYSNLLTEGWRRGRGWKEDGGMFALRISLAQKT